MKPHQFFIFRHGETDWNREMRFQGHTDIPLNDLGREQARELSLRIQKLQLDLIVSSDLSRARETAEIVSQGEIPILIALELREAKIGDPEGMYRKEVIEKYGEADWARWLSVTDADLDFAYPNGETKRDQLHRVRLFLEEFVEKNPNTKKIGVSTHGGTLRRIVHACEGAPTDPVKLPNCALYNIQFKPDSKTWVFNS